MIKTEKEIIEEAFIKDRSFGVYKEKDKQIIVFEDYDQLNRKWKLIE